MTTSSPRWLTDEREALAFDRILDAAGELFAANGVTGVGMAEIATAAGCSRATLYRYFEDRHALRVAFVHREARRLGAAIATEVADVRDVGERLTAAVLAAVDGVRRTPTLAAWFAEASGATATALARSSAVIEGMTAAFLDGGGAVPVDDTRDRARWVVRIVVSLLTMPGDDPAEERRLVERFLVPAVMAR